MLRDAFRHHSWATEQLLDRVRPSDRRGAHGIVPRHLRRHARDTSATSWAPTRCTCSCITGGDLGDRTDGDAIVARSRRARSRPRHAAAWDEVAEAVDPDADLTGSRGRLADRARVGIRLAQVSTTASDHRQRSVVHGVTMIGHRAAGVDVWDYGEPVVLLRPSRRRRGNRLVLEGAVPATAVVVGRRRRAAVAVPANRRRRGSGRVAQREPPSSQLG